MTMQRFGTYNAVLPKEGPKTVPVVLDFRSTNTQLVDFELLIQQDFISYVSGFFVDNSLNNDSVNIQCEESLQKIIIPPKSQAYMPMMITKAAKITVTTTSAADLEIPMQLVNFPVTPCVWSAE